MNHQMLEGAEILTGKLFFSIFLGIALVLVLAPSIAEAQEISNSTGYRPEVSCSHAVLGSKALINIRNAPPDTMVLYTVSIWDESRPLPSEDSLPDFPGTPFTVFTDPQGRLHVPIDMINSEWSGKTLLFQALINDGARGMIPLYLSFQADNPSLYLSSNTSGRESFISIFDELKRELVAELGGLEGGPLKMALSVEAGLLFVLLEGGRIAIYDALTHTYLQDIETGGVVSDLIVTPNGKRLIVLVEGESAVGGRLVTGRLHVYDTKTRSLLDKCSVDPLTRESGRRSLAVSGDSMLVYIAQDSMQLGIYDLLDGSFQRRDLRSGGYSRIHGSLSGEIREVNSLKENLLLALSMLPDERTYLHALNTQNLIQYILSVGSGCRLFKICSDREESPRVALLGRSLEGEGRLWILENFENDDEPEGIPIPLGAEDFDASSVCGLCVLLYPGEEGGEGLIRFVDLERRELLRESMPLPLEPGSQVYLSRSSLSRQAYISSPGGIVTLIDLDRFQVLDRFQLPGRRAAPPMEIY